LRASRAPNFIGDVDVADIEFLKEVHETVLVKEDFFLLLDMIPVSAVPEPTPIGVLDEPSPACSFVEPHSVNLLVPYREGHPFLDEVHRAVYHVGLRDHEF